MARDLINATHRFRVLGHDILGKVVSDKVKIGKVKLEQVEMNSKMLPVC
jgi:hypothetical protein